MIFRKDRWPMNTRWQQRAQAKRIHPVAYSASILPSYEENAPSVLPRWAPTGSLPGCSHAKWLQMRGMIWCWLRAKQNLPGNLATCSSKSQYLSTETDHSHFAHICVGFWTPFFSKYTFSDNLKTPFEYNFFFLQPVFCSYCQVLIVDRGQQFAEVDALAE